MELPFPEFGTFNMRFVQTVDKHGTHELPELFYEGVMFGLSSGNSHGVEVCIHCVFILFFFFLFIDFNLLFLFYAITNAQYSRIQPSLSSKALYDELVNMKPTPTHVLRRYGQFFFFYATIFNPILGPAEFIPMRVLL